MSSIPFWEGHVIDTVPEEPDGSLLVVLAEYSQPGQACLADVPIRRLDCHHYDARVAVHIVWLDQRSRITHRVRLWGEALAQLLPIAHVAKLTGLHWHTIKTMGQQRLECLHGEFSAQDVRRMVMDEFALHKGHRYAAVVLDAQRTRELWVGEGNSREATRPFFEALGAPKAANKSKPWPWT